MTTVVFSDTHLTDHFDAAKCAFLQKIITPADRVIINGDFWEGYETTFDRFVQSDWRKLFPLLKEKNAIYHLGNHDKSQWVDGRVNLFSVAQPRFTRIPYKGNILHIEHGHTRTPQFSRKTWLISRSRIIWNGAKAFEMTGLTLFGNHLTRLFRSLNEEMKQSMEKDLTNGEILVAGHSHFPEKNLNDRYINTGFINHGFGQYLKITGNTLTLVNTRY